MDKENLLRRTYKYRLYPTSEQADALTFQLAGACTLYNAALQERREAWKMRHVHVTYRQQAAQLKEMRKAGDLDLANYCACQDVLRRADKSVQWFFRRLKASEKEKEHKHIGFPRYKSLSRFDSYTYPDSRGNGFQLMPNNTLKIQDVGFVKIKLHRAVAGNIRTLTIKREGIKWYACFSVVIPFIKPEPIQKAVGLDVGITSFIALSDGYIVENPRNLRNNLAKLRRSQRKVARRKRGSNGRREAVLHLKKIHAHIRNQRANFHHKISYELAQNYGFIAVEDLNIKGLFKTALAQSTADVGWGLFLTMLAYKVEYTGGQVVKVAPHGTSQMCSKCGATVKKNLTNKV